MKEMSLLEKIYFREEYWQAARIIGYAGCTPLEFWDARPVTLLEPATHRPRTPSVAPTQIRNFADKVGRAGRNRVHAAFSRGII